MSEPSGDHERWSDELAAYLLGALPARDAEECERHLKECGLCQAQARWLTPAVEQLPQNVPPVAPPPGLRERVMAEVRDEEPARSGQASSASPGPSWIERIGASFRRRPLVGVAAAVLLIAAALVGVEAGTGGGGDGSTTIVAGHPPGVTAKVVRRGDSATLKLANVRPLHRKRVLEAWVQREGQVEPVKALFVPDHEGRAQTTIGDMSGVEVVMVTTEPQGGSRSPTSSPIVSVAID
jgi:anti-sigma-K factor RskA